MPSSPISPGANATFTINATAPATPGSLYVCLEDGPRKCAVVRRHLQHDHHRGRCSALDYDPAGEPDERTRGRLPPSPSPPPAPRRLSYQWQKNGANLSNGGNIAGATSSSLTVSSVQISDAANYAVVVTNLGRLGHQPARRVDGHLHALPHRVGHRPRRPVFQQSHPDQRLADAHRCGGQFQLGQPVRPPPASSTPTCSPSAGAGRSSRSTARPTPSTPPPMMGCACGSTACC